MSIVTRKTKAGKNRYLVRIADYDPATGKRVNRNIGTFGTKRQAEIEESKAISEREGGTLMDRTKLTVSTLLDQWLATKSGEVEPNTIVGYSVSCRHIADAIGGVKVQALTTSMIQDTYNRWRDDGMGTRTIKTCHQRLSQALDMAARHGLVHTNVATAARPPKDESKRIDVWTATEMSRFLAKAKEDAYWPLWPLLAIEGLRRGEALGLRWRDIDWNRSTATIVQTVRPDLAHGGKAVIAPRAKSNASHRTVTLTADTLDALRGHRKRQAENRLASSTWADRDLIVTSRTGGPVSPGGNVQRSLNAIIARAELPRMTVHGLRHCAATFALASGVPLAVVSKRLGHKSIQITADIYGRVTSEMQGDAATKISAALARAQEKSA